MKQPLLSLLAAAALAAPTGPAATLALSGTADADGTHTAAFSDVFARIDLEPDGFYQIGNPAVRFGSYDVFPNEAAFTLGTLTYDDITGAGAETAAVTALVADWFANVDPSWGAYTTAFSGLAGTASFQDGRLTAINLTADVTFTFTAAPLIGAAYPGRFTVAGDRFQLDAAGAPGGAAMAWSFAGRVNQVPEPGPLVLGALGVAATACLRRRRAAGAPRPRC